MGLDMYANKLLKAQLVDPTAQVDLDIIEPDDIFSDSQIHYWRKHNYLHEWMKELYLQKGGKDHEFNCDTVRLDLEDLRELELAVKNNFGRNLLDKSPNTDDLEFIKKARAAIADEYIVYYDSWW